MSLFAEASASLGVPAWAVPISAGIYALSAVVERQMRPQARAQIGDYLDHATLKADLPPIAAVVQSAFLATFGQRQWSWRCFSRTLLFSVFTIYAICLLLWAKHGGAIRARIPGLPSLPSMLLTALPGVLAYSAVQNWLSIGKTRLILARIGRPASAPQGGLARLLAWMLLDLVLSYAISVAVYWTANLLIAGPNSVCITVQSYGARVDCRAFSNPLAVIVGILGVSTAMLMRAVSDAGAFSPANILAFAEGVATLLTSIWTLLVLMALLLLRALTPVNALLRGARWAFDLRAHPVQAIGIVVAILVWLGALVYALA